LDSDIFDFDGVDFKTSRQIDMVKIDLKRKFIKFKKKLRLFFKKTEPFLVKLKPYLAEISIIVTVVFLNLLLGYLPQAKIDLTKDKVHSLSPQSIKIIKNLNNLVKITVYQTDDLPLELKPLVRNFRSILEEFRRINSNGFKVIYLDPSKDTETREKANKQGIRAIQFSTLNSDKYEVKSGYFGLTVEYGGKSEVLPVAGDVGNLEYFLVSTIKKIDQKDISKVLMAEDNDLKNTEYKYFRQFLNQNYTVGEANLENLSNEKKGVLIMVGSFEGTNEKINKNLKNWVNRGNSLIIFWNRISIDERMQARDVTSDWLNEFLKEVGIEVKRGLVSDPSASVANFKTNSGSFLTEYPYWPEVKTENMNSEIPVMSGINSLSFEWISPIIASENLKILFSSSNESILDEKFTNISPPVSSNNLGKDKKKMILGALRTKTVKIAVVGDADFIKDRFVVNHQDNMIFGLNLVDYLSNDDTLLEIRSKSINDSRIKEITNQQKNSFKTINLLAPFVILILIYLFTWKRRKLIKF
jgi:ABC-type uncharacterized transport system involved in gliding motility auxiliary subunit